MVENNQQQEIWRTTNEYPGYTFSNKGRVYSYKSNPNRYLSGFKNKDKYIQLCIRDYNNEKRQPYLSRIVYSLFGNSPELLPHREVDHIEREEKTNNNINNLRLATPEENCANRGKMLVNQQGNTPSSNYIGVCFHKRDSIWCGKIVVKGKTFHLGSFKHDKNCAWVYNRIARLFKPQNHWHNTLGEDFELPHETENRDQVIAGKISKIQSYLDSL